MKRFMAVYDVDPLYAERFAEFANRTGSAPLKAVAFTSIKRLREYAGQEGVELLLVGDEVTDEELRGVNAGQIIRLSETGVVKDESPTIYKYQASDSVLREVMACYQTGAEPELLTAAGPRSRIIGVYSPIARCGKTSFAFTLGQALARDGKALLLSLEEFSGLACLTGTAYEGGLSDLLYYYRQGEYSRLRLASVVYNRGGLDYVPPVTYAEDLALFKGAELSGLIERIAGEGIYDEIVLDLGHFTGGVEEELKICDVIYVPVKEDAVSAAKLKEWREYLEKSGRDRLWEKVRILKLPRPNATAGCETYLEQLLWGEMGDFVRELIGGAGRGGV